VRIMKGTVLYGPRDVRFEEREEPRILNPTDAVRSCPNKWCSCDGASRSRSALSKAP